MILEVAWFSAGAAAVATGAAVWIFRGAASSPLDGGSDQVPHPANELLERRLRRLELLREIANGLARAGDIKEVLYLFNKLVPARCAELGVSRIRLLLSDLDGTLSSEEMFTGNDPTVALLHREGTSSLRAAAAKVMSERVPVHIKDISKSELVDKKVKEQANVHSTYLVPILAKNEPLGVLEIDQGRGGTAINKVDEEFFALIADQLGAIIENTRLIAELRRAEHEARENEKKYRLIAENNTDFIWLVDRTGRYLYISPSVSRLLGYTAEELRDRAALDALTPSPTAAMGEDLLHELGIDARAIAKYKTSQMQHEVTRADGTRIWVETQASMVRDEEGNLVGYQGVTRDIDLRMKSAMALKASEVRFRAIFQEAMDGIFIIQADQSVLDANPMGCHLLRRSRDEVLAMSFKEFMLVPTADELDMTDPRFEDGVRLESLAVRSDGLLVPVEVSIGLFDADRDGLYLAIIRDITERRESSRRQKVMDRRMRGIVESADELITCASSELLYRRAVDLARDRLGLGTCAIFHREGVRIRGTWGVNEDGHTVDRRSQVFAASEDWLELLRPKKPGASRAVYTRASIPTEAQAGLRFPTEEWSVAAQIRNAAQQPVALFLAEAPSHEGREAEDLAEVVAIYCSLLGGIIERRLIEDAIKESEERARSAFLAKKREMDKIAEVHNRLIPTRIDPVAGLAFAAQCRPSADVGGDFYLVLPLRDGRVAVVIADVSGHGAKAAVATATSRALLHSALSEIEPSEGPGKVLHRVSSWLQDQLDIEQFVTMWLGIWDPSMSQLVYSSCAHHPAIRFTLDGKVGYTRQESVLPVGLADVQVTPPPEQRLSIGIGDRIFLYTDGWVETPSASGEMLEGERFIEFIADSEGQPLEQLTLFLFTQFEHFVANTKISDDVTLLVFERRL